MNTATAVLAPTRPTDLAQRVFKVAVAVNLALTAFCVLAYGFGFGARFTGEFTFTAKAVGQVVFGIVFFNVVWAFVWYGVKNLLLKYLAKFSPEERREAFSSRMSRPYDLPGLLERHSERRIRIIDMIGRRGRFITLAGALFFYLYASIDASHPENFATAFLSGTLFDGVLTQWLFIGLYYSNGVIAAAVFGPQSRVMDGGLARANCLTITMLWGLFKFAMVPIGTAMVHLYSPEQFAVVFALIWGSYIATDTFAEVGGSLYGKMKIRVIGIGDVNRKSIAGTLTGFVAGLTLCLVVVTSAGLPASFIGLAIVISLSNTLLELFSPRGTDDFTMAVGNALLCWAFGAWVLG
jgi:dolichol kinase